MSASERLTRLLRLRPGETRPLAAMGSFLLLGTATTTILSAVKNGLFLSVYPGELIPHAVIAGALLTAVVAVVFTGFLAGVARRSLALGLTFTLAVSLVACRLLFAVAPRSAFGIYLWVSVVQVLVLTHAWDYASDLLTGRQTKRILPLIGVGASLGAIFGGLGVAPAAFSLGTENLLWVAVALMVGALPVLWTIREPMREPEEPAVRMSAVAAFVQRASRGLRSIASHDLLRLLAVGLIALTLTGTLIDLQLKFLLQETYPRDRITAIYGLLSAAVGAGTLLLQVWAARVLFPVHGVSVAAILHGGLLTLAAAGVAVFGGLYALVIAQALDDILQFSLQKPVEQVSLLPLPNRTKSVTLATLGGVLRPLSKASAGAFALVLGARSPLLPLATVAAALVATLAYSRHKRRYLTALEGAVSRHVVDLSHRRYVPLVVDAGAVGAIDKALLDADPTIVVFATSLLEQLPAADAMPRVLRLLGHPVPEVRAEAARVLRELDAPADFATGVAIAGQLAVERTPSVIATLLETIGLAGGPHPETIVSFLQHEDPQVRRAALVALGRLAWPDTDRTLRALLASSDPSERAVGAGAVGELGKADLLDALVPVLFEAQARHAALEALTALGSPAVPVMAELLRRRELPLPLRRSIVTALSGVPGWEARTALLDLLREPALGPAALTSLARMRDAGAIPGIDPRKLRAVVHAEVQRGLRYAAAAGCFRSSGDGELARFVSEELHGLHQRSAERVLKLLALSYDATRVRTVAAAMASPSAHQRSNALELLDGTLSRPVARTVIPFLEVASEGLPRARVDDLLEDRRAAVAPTEVLVEDDDWWPRALALHLLGRDAEITTPGISPDPTSEDGMIPLVEKVMILKGSEFFRNFPGGDLAGVASLAEVVHLDAGDVVFEQGDEGDAFYVVVQGAIRISRGSTELATLGPREGFGEMAILDRESRSATATAVEPTTLLKLDRDSFDSAVEQNPVVARGIYRVLTERLRNTLAQVAAG